MSTPKKAIIVSIKGTNEAVVINPDGWEAAELAQNLHKASEIVLKNYLSRFFAFGEPQTAFISDDVACEFMSKNSDPFINYIEGADFMTIAINHKIIDIRTREYNVNLTVSTVLMLESTN